MVYLLIYLSLSIDLSTGSSIDVTNGLSIESSNGLSLGLSVSIYSGSPRYRSTTRGEARLHYIRLNIFTDYRISRRTVYCSFHLRRALSRRLRARSFHFSAATNCLPRACASNCLQIVVFTDADGKSLAIGVIVPARVVILDYVSPIAPPRASLRALSPPATCKHIGDDRLGKQIASQSRHA